MIPAQAFTALSRTMKRALMVLVVVLTLAVAGTGCARNAVVSGEFEPIAEGADGATVYAARCASCHGDDLRGSDRGPSQLSIVYEPNHHNDASYQSAIRNGVQQHHWGFGNMPIVENITDDQVDLVIAFIRSEQERLGFES